MAIQKLVKGELDWHEKINANFEELEKEAAGGSGLSERVEELETAKEQQDQTNQTVNKSLGNKLDKAAKIPEGLQEGYVFQKEDGTTELRQAETPESEKFKYTIVVDNGSDGNPASVEYTDDCYGFLEANGSDLGDWANTKLIKEYFRPCVIDAGDGAPKYYLKQEDMSKKESGEAAITTGGDGDVMIEIKKLYGKFLKSGKRLKISISNVKEDDTWFCFNQIGDQEKDVVYRGAFKAGVVGANLMTMRSVSGVAPLVSQTRATMRAYASNRGAGYHQNNFYILMLYQVMYLLLYKNKNSQTALGQGRSLSSNTTTANTGWSLSKPFCWGDQGGVNGVKFLGVEDFYGNVWEWVDGVCSVNKVYKLTRDPVKYNDTGDGYEISVDSGLTAATNSDKYITEVQGTNDLGFLPAASGGSSSTHWCDNMWFADAVQVVGFGGRWANAAMVGAFCWALHYVASSSGASIGSRLCRA